MRGPDSSGEFVVALCGPSGVGKGYVKKRAIDVLGDVPLSEPVVATTREPRKDDGPDREAGIDAASFFTRVDDGDIVLPHRPFRDTNSPLYGFTRESLDAPYLLTEVHSTVLGEFHALFPSRPRMVMGFVADESTLAASIRDRQGDTSDGAGIELRLACASAEIAEIERGYEEGHVDRLYDCTKLGRAAVQELAITEMVSFVRAQHV